MKVTALQKWLGLFLASLCLSACSGNYFFESWNTHPEATTSAPAAQVEEPKPVEQYRAVDDLPPKYTAAKKTCVTGNDGRQTCGYDCKVSGNDVQCATDPKQRCVVAPSGAIKCGYDCKVTDTSAKCGKYLYSNCLVDHYGDVQCGSNCKLREDGEVVCGK